MIEFANNKIQFTKYIPDISGYMQHDRKWIVNMSNLDKSSSYLVNSLIPDDFDEFVKRAMHEREEKHITKKNIRMNIKSEFVELFRGAQTTSSKATEITKFRKSRKVLSSCEVVKR